MKISKLLLAGLFVAGFAGAASAQTVIHIVGSTAYRAPVEQAIVDYFSTRGGDKAVFWGNSNFYKAQGVAISGSTATTGGVPVIVETYWTGSAAGVVDLVTANKLASFISGTFYASTATSGNGTLVAGTPVFDSAVAPDSAMSDTLFTDVAKSLKDAAVTGSSGAALANTISSSGLKDAGATAGPNGTVGIVPFLWLLGNPGTGGGHATNISQQAAEQLVLTGNVNFSEISGSAADISNFALLIGRNEDSGTRIDSLAESQAEPTNNFDAAPIQTFVTFSGTVSQSTAIPTPTVNQGLNVGGNNSNLSAVKAWTAGTSLNTEPGISWAVAGHSGYISGGDVGNVLLSVNNGGISVDPSLAPASSFYTPGSSQFSLIGYISAADAGSALGLTQTNARGNALALSYNGVSYSVSNVENGTYTLWAYEHMYYTAPTGTTKTVLDGIADKVFNTDADIDTNGAHASAVAAGILFNNMNVGRAFVEGGNIQPF